MKENNAAQAATQHPIDEAICLLSAEAESIRECHTPGCDRNDWTGESEAKAAHDNMMRVAAALSKLRAPVSSIREGFELTYAADSDDPACASDLSHFTNGWRACVMSQVRAPVADERQAVAYLDLGAGGYMDVGTDLTDKQLAALPKGRHMLAIIGTHGVDGYTPASAPVTDLRPHLEWALRRIRTSLDTGGKYEAAQAALDAAKAAPQASALAEEYTRGRADGFDAGYSAALEKAAALVGGHTWAGASQIVSDLIAAHIRALKTLADKDGGQQRAEDAERWRWATATDESAQVLYTIVQAYGGDQKKINERADFYRTALSAPQAEQGERDE